MKYHYFNTKESPQLKGEYFKGLAEALKRYNVDGAVLSTVSDYNNDQTSFVLVQTDEGLTLGGIRIEKRTLHNKLPVEKICTPHKKWLDLKIHQLHQENKTVAELCGLWVNSQAKELVGFGRLGGEICRKSTDYAFSIGVDTLAAISPTHSIKYTLDVGFKLDEYNFNFAYPDDRYLSSVLWCERFNYLSLSATTNLNKQPELSI